MELTRRGFVAGSAVAAAATAGSAIAVADEAPAARFIDSIEWNAVYDVVVIGFGAAGAATSITAADDGANVLLIEKAPRGHEGGDSIYSGQCCMGVAADHVEDLKTYFIGMCDRYSDWDDECFQAMAEGCAENYDWLVSLGADGDVLRMNEGETGWRSAGSGYFWNENPFLPGAGYNVSWVVGADGHRGGLYYLLHENVEARENITVWYSAPAKHLIQDPMTKTIVGVQLEKDGQMVNVLARNGVVMTCGGFENNEKMHGSYLQRPYCYCFAGVFNEGDGVKMAIEVGADLWHMSNSAGFTWSYKNDILEHALYPFAVRNGILVGPGGTRFMNEAYTNKHGRIDIGGRMIQTPYPNPTHFIADSEAIANAKIYAAWGDGNQKAIDKGWLMKADTIEELAEAIGVDAEKLQKTIDDYNAAYDEGRDADYGRPADKIIPVRTPPFYYLEVGQTMYNTQGGARRNARAEIVNPSGEPIPHLYSAGDFGAIWPDMYNGSGNLGETQVFGRIAGHAAATPKDDVLPAGEEIAIVDLGIVDEPPVYELEENEYLGVGRGKGGYLTLKCKIVDGVIEDITILSMNESVGIADDAIAEIPAKIIETQSTELDVIAGVTVTSHAIMDAVADALAKANA